MLYDKTHTHRDKVTRREDLLRRFLDGMLDENARFQVEFVKEPRDIDQAVYAVVCFQETKSRKRKLYGNEIKSTEMACSDKSSSDDDAQAPVAAIVFPGKKKHSLSKHEKDTKTNSEVLSADKIAEIVRTEMQSFQNETYQTQDNTKPYYQGQRIDYQTINRGCFVCGENSHFKVNCSQF